MTEPNTAFRQPGASRLARLWPLLAVLPFLVLAWEHWNDAPSLYSSDYAQYLLHAEAIAEGRPYGDIGYIYTAHNPIVGPRLQPPGWPLILAPFVAIFGTGLLVPKILVTLAACAFLGAVAVRISRDDTPMVALFTAAICGVALESDYAINTPLSDLPFAAVLWGVILLADSEAPLSWPRAAGIWLAGILAMSIRVLGVALIPGLLLLAILRRRDRARLLTIAFAWGALGVAVMLAVGIGRVPFLGMVLESPLKMLPQFSDAMHYRYSVLLSWLYPFPWNLGNDAYHLAAPILVIPGLVEFMRRFGRSAVSCVAVGIMVVLFAAPVADGRYLWPLWPILGYGLVAGVRFWMQRLRIPVVRQAGALNWGIGLLIAASVLTSLSRPSYPAFSDNRAAVAAVEWVKNEARVAALRVVFISPRVLTLETGVSAMPWFARPPDVTVAEMRRARITHVIVGDFGFGARWGRSMEATIRARPADFELVHGGENFSVYRFIASPADSGSTESRDRRF